MIPDKEPVNTWDGNSSNITFDFDFLINSEKELLVLHTDKTGIQNILKLNIDYTIHQTGNADGSYITFPILGSSYKTLGEEEKITLMLNIPIAQTSPYGTSDKLNLKSLEFSLDYIVRLIQMVNRKVERSVKVQEGSRTTPDDLIESLNQAQVTAQSFANAAQNSAVTAGEAASTAAEKASETTSTYNTAKTELEAIKNDMLDALSNSNTLRRNQLTNAILEAPKHIKLALSGGNLVLKAGSVVSIPNGFEEDGTTLHFDYVEIENDLTLASYNGTYTECVSVNPSIGLNSANADKCFSSATAPTFTGVGLWYDLQNNLLKYSLDSGTTWTSGFSMPLCLCGVVNNVRSSIDEIFNVIGYIGNTLWASKGLKILAPNGRNEDGSLKNIEYTLVSDSSKELSSAATGLGVFFLRSLDNGQTWDIGYRSYGTQGYIQEEQPQVEHCEWYNPKTNLWKHCVSGEWSDILICPLGRVSCNEGQILSLYNYETIDLLKRSDRREIIEWDRPNLTAGITKLFNTTYTAEEDGWLQSLTILVAQTSASAGTSSTIDVSTTIDGVEVYHNKAQIVNPSGVAVDTATQTANIVRIHKGQQYRMFQSYKAGTSNIHAHALTFYPLLHE